MRRLVLGALALVSGASAQSEYRCTTHFDASACPSASPGLIGDVTVECGCSNGADPSIAVAGTSVPCDDHTVCCELPTCALGFNDNECSGRIEPLGPTCTPNDNSPGSTVCTLNTASTGCEPLEGCTFKAADQVKAETECEWGTDGSAQCTTEHCCQPSSETATDCEGFYAVCDSTDCKVQTERLSTFIEQVPQAHGGRACPEPKNCFDEPQSESVCLPKILDNIDDCDANADSDSCNAALCSFQPAYDGTCMDQCRPELCTDGVSTLAPNASGAQCDGACTETDCCVPNSCSLAPRCVGETADSICELTEDETDCISISADAICHFQSAEKAIGTMGYYAENPDATTVAGLGNLGCSTGKKHIDTSDKTSVGGFIGHWYNVRVTCPEDGGTFQWEGCTEAANCDGAANREKSEATCEAKGLRPSCTLAADWDDKPISCSVNVEDCIATCTGVSDICTSVGQVLTSTGFCEYNANEAGQQLQADVDACSAIQGADLADATACLGVITTAAVGEEGDCGGVQCRTINPATCTVPDDTCPSTPCVFEDGNGCPDGCTFSRQTGEACDYTPAILSDMINMQDLGEHVQDTEGDDSCARINPEGKLSHFDSCKVMCEDGYHLVESKRDEHLTRISNPKYWRPLHPQCDNGILHYSVSCEKDTDWTGVLIIVLVLGFFLILIPVVKYMRVVGVYNKDKAAGCTWAPDGTKIDPRSNSDEAAD